MQNLDSECHRGDCGVQQHAYRVASDGRLEVYDRQRRVRDMDVLAAELAPTIVPEVER